MTSLLTCERHTALVDMWMPLPSVVSRIVSPVALVALLDLLPAAHGQALPGGTPQNCVCLHTAACGPWVTCTLQQGTDAFAFATSGTYTKPARLQA